MLAFLEKYREKIKKSKTTLENFYRSRKLETCPIIFNLSPYYLLKNNKVDVKNYFSSPFSALEIQLKSIEEHLEIIKDDYIPYLSPYYGVCAMASGFGGKVTFYEDKDPWLNEHIIKDFKDINKVKKPDPERSGLMTSVFNLMRVWKKEVKGKIPLGHTDIQGPISICIDLMGAEKFFLGVIDCPEKIHNLLEIVTEYIISVLKISYRIIGDGDGHYLTGIYVPAGFGKVRISEDNIVFISSEFCEEFLNPYIEHIFYEIGNGIIHWCGDGYKNLDEILKIKNITGINNCSMGNINIIKKQNEISIKRKIFYQNEVILPKPEWFIKLNDIIKKEYLIHHFIVPSDEFGVSFNGYEAIGEDKINCINNLLKINNNHIDKYR